MINRSSRMSIASVVPVIVVVASVLVGGVSSSWALDCPDGLAREAVGEMSSDFKGTSIAAGRYIWFNANLKASGIGPGLTTIQSDFSIISFQVGPQYFTLRPPKSQITFDPNATCATTSFNVGLQRWETTVPITGSDEIFLSGVAFLVPYDFPGGIKPVTWFETFTTCSPGLKVSWKWSAAVYDNTDMSDYNALGVKPTHTNACLYQNSDHAGTPENKKSFVVAGARGSGGSNWTGSWSGTQGLKLIQPPRLSLISDGVTNLSFANTETLAWAPALGATVYDVLSGDLADLKAARGLGGAFCAQDDLAATELVDEAVPEPDQCIFYVIRGDAVSSMAGSYDSDGPAPIGQEGRDATTGTAGGVDCTHYEE